jgi:two-component system, response regulator, stage 0 sporulation protein F
MPGEVIPPAALSPRGYTILIVEDDSDVGEFLQRLIEEETPYSSAVIENGWLALEEATQINPCLLMLDYRLPGINGIELYDRLQQREELNGVPAIMMSAALPLTELERRGIHPLHKPMEIGHVIRMITHALATSDERRLYQHQQYQ